MANLETKLIAKRVLNKFLDNAPFYGWYNFAEKRRNNLNWQDSSEVKTYTKQLVSTAIGALFIVAGLAYAITSLCDYINN